MNEVSENFQFSETDTSPQNLSKTQFALNYVENYLYDYS
jgi:hypothetical protein